MRKAPRRLHPYGSGAGAVTSQGQVELEQVFSGPFNIAENQLVKKVSGDVPCCLLEPLEGNAFYKEHPRWRGPV